MTYMKCSRDPDKRDLCLSYLNGISVFSFALSTNVSTLNRWQTRPLVIAGAWRDSNVEIDIGADVAADIAEEAETARPEFVRSLAEPIADTGGLGYIRRGLLNEDEALRLILQSTPVAFSPQTQSFLGLNPSKEESNVPDGESENIVEQKSIEMTQDHDLSTEQSLEEDEQDIFHRSPSPEMFLSRSATVSPTLEWDNPAVGEEPVSSPCLAEEIEQADEVGYEEVDDSKSPEPDQTAVEPCLTPPSRCQSPLSNSSSLSICHCPPGSPRPDCRMCGDKSPAPRVNLVLSEDVQTGGDGDLISQQQIREKRLVGMGFSSPPSIRVTALSLAQNISMTRCLDLICHEVGLDKQDWRCEDCSKSIGALFGQPRLCHYTRKYYCDECHTNTDTAIIPARLMYNWDAASYKVAKSSKMFLKAVATKPIFNAISFSPNLSKLAPVLDNAHRLRQQLTYLSAYLTACSKANTEGVKVALAEVVWPRDYLYTETEMYSINDLEELHTGVLIPTLASAVKLCTSHVASCLICSGRGFICEVCRDKKPVYPFNLDTTSQCRDCHTVFHSQCAKDIMVCPRCERIEARNLQWHVNNSKLARELGEEPSNL